MKTQKNNALNLISKCALLAIVLMTAACGNQKDTSGGSAGSEAQAKVDPPKVDIHTAVLTGNMEALKQHIAAGSNLNEKDPYGGSSPLISASLFGKTEEAKVLIEAGADINFQNNDGSTALHTASFFCRTEIVQLLLDKGADKTIKNKFGATAYESVAVPFADVKNAYDMMATMLGPMGLTLDYAHLEKTRPVIATMLQ